MMNSDNSMKFSSDAAKAYAERIAEKEEKLAVKTANRLIKYIEARYEKKIKKVLDNGSNESSVNIVLPCFTKIVNKTVITLVESHFSELGFDGRIIKGNKCGCPFDFLCNYDWLQFKLTWK